LRFALIAILSLALSTPPTSAQPVVASTLPESEFAKYVRESMGTTGGDLEKAYADLAALDDKKIAPERLHLKYFLLGDWALNLKKYSEARAHLDHSLKLNPINAAYIYYLTGHTFKVEGNNDDALKAYNKVLDSKPASNILFTTRFEMSEIAMHTNKLVRAQEHLQYLERRWRSNPRYPEIIWNLMLVEMKENRKYLACKWARKLFAKYPGHALVKDWGIELPNNLVDGEKVGCAASDKDVQQRMRDLQLAGADQKARQEIDFLRAHARPNEKTHTDTMLANYYEMQGYPDEALQILIQHYDELKNNFNYQSMLGKVATQAGEFQAAIGAYYNSYRLSPRSKGGRGALFSSGFLSYQIQDYDGAYRRFTDLIKKNGSSGLARDARWHLAWIQYLKGDFAGAESEFRKLYKEKIYVSRRRRRTTPQPFHNERTEYWLAMTLVRQKKYDEARELLRELSSSKGRSFYAIVAEARLSQLPETPAPAAPPAPVQAAAPASAPSVAPSPAVATAPADKTVATSTGGEREEAGEEYESEETLQMNATDSDESSDVNETADMSTGPQLKAAGDEESEKSVPEPDETVKVSEFKDPKLRERFSRASDFMILGLNEFAQWELLEVERRTSNKTYLRMLMDAYYRVGSFDRVAYIAEIYFGGERERGGSKEAYDLWRFDFPQAYQDLVTKFANKSGAPEALVYAIMRAESQFNSVAVSPVGARGLMQLMPYTVAQLAKLGGEPPVSDEDLLKPENNLRLGARYLARLFKKFSGEIPLVAASYNAGPHRVYSWLSTFGSLEMDEFIEHVPFVETRNYVKKVVRNYVVYSEIYGHDSVSTSFKPAGKTSISTHNTSNVWLTEPIGIKISTRPSPRENWESID
jgi:soluble lytic murein transglycosylase